MSQKVEGFPASAVVYHFHPIAFVEQMRRVVGKEDIDLSDPDKWISQWTQPNAKVACWRTCVLILKEYGVEGGGLGRKLNETYRNGTNKWSNVIQTVVQLQDGTLIGTGREQEGLDYLDSQLEKGRPVIVGLDDGRRITTYNKDNSTEHFVVITGRLTDEKGLYYRFFEVGTKVKNKMTWGVSLDNKLRKNEFDWLVGLKRNVLPNREYTVTEIRKNN